MLVLTRIGSDKIIDDMNNIVSIGLGYNGVEKVGNGYDRASVSSGLFGFDSEDEYFYYYKNSSQIAFPNATGDWGSINEIYFFDSSGNKIYTLVMDSVIGITTGITFVINAGGLILKVKKQS
jgi:hypothetical protein